ncbi:hypothetical protein GUJ93_ZPchr0002g23881 [Zizania palustris]|uniref:Uncharacterized protein n=1 Tax=Zizania palustris TaxID=103762 RepID=A0A8J5S0A5_ZIZPA|nr:hypothetical protein GUJ93_ZPchr0002g23881 [Zizania palustris]
MMSYVARERELLLACSTKRNKSLVCGHLAYHLFAPGPGFSFIMLMLSPGKTEPSNLSSLTEQANNCHRGRLAVVLVSQMHVAP